MPESTRVAGWLFLTGGVVAIIGAFWPPYKQWYSPVEESLRIIAAHPVGWRIIHAGFFAGTVVCAFGFAALARSRAATSADTLSTIAAVAYVLATVFWSTNIAYRLSVQSWAANEFVTSGVIPPMFVPFSRYAGMLFTAFIALAAVALASTGGMALRSGIAPRWVGWIALGVGVIGGPMVGMIGPWVLYVPIVMLGAALLRA